ncbi:MAG: hypothetical protein V4474_02145 [Patescibacteria group bacterium]
MPFLPQVTLACTVTWVKQEKRIWFATLLHQLALPKVKDEADHFDVLTHAVRPFLPPKIDPAISWAIVAANYAAEGSETGDHVSGYLGIEPCADPATMRSKLFAHICCATSSLYLALPVLERVASAGWPAKDDCVFLVQREHEMRKMLVERYCGPEVGETVEEPEEAALFAAKPN